MVYDEKWLDNVIHREVKKEYRADKYIQKLMDKMLENDERIRKMYADQRFSLTINNLPNIKDKEENGPKEKK